MTTVAAMGPPGGGRTFISNRILRHYHMLTYTDISDEVITTIFSTSLKFFLSSFSEGSQALVGGLVSSMLDLYKTVIGTLLPTPSKSHYTFNLRDIWKVFQGVCSLDSKTTKTEQGVIRCWVHEVTRVFGDRLINDTDRKWLKDVMLSITTKSFEMDESVIYNRERLVFGDFMTDGSVENRPYQEITDMGELKSLIEKKLEEHNDSGERPMPLVMFLDACEHVARICRVLRQPSGNALLLGVGGSGRQSLTRLASFIMESTNFQIEVKKGYRMSEWQEKLRDVMLLCGRDNKVHTFLLVDTQIVMESMLEDINSVLNSGDVPNLYKAEHEESIMEKARPLCAQMNLQPTKTNIFSCYLMQLKKNIHVVLAMSPVSSTFRTRLRMFPSLVNCTTIDWFSEWPAEALYSVAKQQISEQDLGLKREEETLQMFKTIHQSVEHASLEFLAVERRHNHVTPTSYLELLSTFTTILEAKRKTINVQRQRFLDGLEMLREAEDQVADLQKDLEEQKPILNEKDRITDAKTAEIQEEKREADIIRVEAERQQELANEDFAVAAKIQKEAKEQLDVVLPELNASLESLGKMKADQLQTVAGYANPPVEVKCVIEALAILMNFEKNKKDEAHPYFDSGRKFLASAQKALGTMREFPEQHHVYRQTVGRVKARFHKEEYWNFAAIEKKSSVVAVIFTFIESIIKYAAVKEIVGPLEEQAEAASTKANAAEAVAKESQMKLEKIQEKVASLEAQHEQLKADKKALEENIKDCEVKLDRANKLTSGLSGEKIRWSQNVKDLEADLELVPGNSLIAAGMVAYMGPFTGKYRERLEDEWRVTLSQMDIDYKAGINMKDFLGDAVEIRKWNAMKLPTDTVSVENAIIMTNARRFPLLIDPQKQANMFLKNLAARHLNDDSNMSGAMQNFIVTKLSEDYMRQCELAIPFGKWVIMENIGEELDPSLDPILLQQVVREGSGLAIKLGEKSVQYSKDFKFFMTTTLPNPHYAPELQVKVSLLNFAITPAGLEEQMLAKVVQFEAPQLEADKMKQMKELAHLKNELKRLEDLILSEVQKSKTKEGGVLGDESLIGTLADAKETSAKSSKQLEEAEITNREIDRERENYRPVAFRASLLFFCIVELANLDPMYQYSLQWYQLLFDKGIENAAPSNVLSERLNHLNESFTHLLYQNICRSLFEKHKTLFSFAMTTQIMQGFGKIDNDEMRFLLTGQVPQAPADLRPNPTEWLDRAQWIEIQYLSTLPAFHGLAEYFEKNTALFKDRVFDFVDAHQAVLPGPWEERLPQKSLRRMCFLRTMRMDRLINAMYDFVALEMGVKFVTPPVFDLKESYNDSSATTPLILILSPGSDPVADFKVFAKEAGLAESRIKLLSLGAGQGDAASRQIDEFISSGGWVLLQNCHLAISWMEKLEQKVERLSAEGTTVHPDFRLWLTSMPDKDFSVSVLQNSVKMTNEPPRGLLKNLERSYKNLDDRVLDDCKDPVSFKRLLFGFCFFHAIVQDRRKFGPIGWNIAYDFTAEDLMVCRRQLKIFLDKYDYVPYKVLNYLGSQINYGGRVTDAQDKRLISYILKTYVNEDLVTKGAGYKFSESGIFHCPDADDQAGFLSYIEGLPPIPPPEAFGLHENANITFAQNEAEQLLDGMIRINNNTAAALKAEELSLAQSMVEGGDLNKSDLNRSALNKSSAKAAKKTDDHEEGHVKKSKDQLQEEIARSLLERTPPIFDLEMVSKQYPTRYEESINTVLVQECTRYNALLSAMSSQLKEFLRALKGEVVMSADLDKLGQSIYENAVPGLWAPNVGFLSLKPLFSWLEDLEKRVAFLNDWIANGTPIACWISGLFFPQAFLTGVMQNYARAHSIAIDQLSFQFAYLDHINNPADIKEKPKDGCYVHGIYLEGARWNRDSHCVAESKPKVLYEQLPVVHLRPSAEKRKVPSDGTYIYECPIYKVLSRAGTLSTTGHSTNFVMNLEMPSKDIEDKWIKAGVAGFLALKN